MSIKKGWKITWITLGSLLGLVVVTVAVALWLVFTPSKLTKIVNSLAGKFITCDAHFENVDLTLLSTFPDAGLRIDNVVIVNPMEGAPSDTLAFIGSLTVGIDAKAFIKENKVIVHQVALDDAMANLYIAKDGQSNFDIFPPSDDTTQKESNLPEVIDLKKINVDNLNALLTDERDGMDANVAGLGLTLKGRMDNNDIDGKLAMESRHVTFRMADKDGKPKLATELEGLTLDAKGGMKGDDIDATVSIDGKEVAYNQYDSTGAAVLKTLLEGVGLDLKGKGTLTQVAGKLKMRVENGTLTAAGTEMVNEKLQASKETLLAADIPFAADLQQMKITLGESSLKIDDYGLRMKGTAQMQPMAVDVVLHTDGAWQVKPLLAIVPATYTGMLKGMDMDGKVALEATAQGIVSDSTMPIVDAHVTLEKGQFYSPKMLPYRLSRIGGDMTAHLDLGKNGKSHAVVKRLTAHTQGTDLSVKGRADDLTGDMKVDATIRGTLPLEDVMPMLPPTMKVTAKGDADVDLYANFKMSQLKKQAYEQMKASGILKLKGLDVTYDSLHATSPTLDIALQLPAKAHNGQMADAHITSGTLKVTQGKKLKAELENADISVGVNNMVKQQLAATYDIKVGETEATMDSTLVSLGGLKLKGSVRMDSTKNNVLLQYNPLFEASTHSAVLYMPTLPDAVRLSELSIDYKPNHCEIEKVQVRLGHSDFALYGTVENLEEWLDKKAMLKGDLNFTSSYADVDQIMDMFSGMGSDKDSLEQMRKEDAVPADANPFIVPKDVDITLHTHIQRSVAFGNDLNDVAGSLTVKDGVAILDQVGFVCKAATMQLTALYKSPRPSNLFAALDFHLLDIQIHELLDMIPAVDTLVPMLSAFDGNANFHLAGETYLNARYQPKMSSIKGAAAISGQDLVVMDNKNIATIAKLMRFKSWKDKDDKIKVDSLSVEMTCMDDGLGTEVEILPFLLSVGNYQLCISGVQNLDKNCSYHLELLKNPLLAKVGVDVRGSIMDPKISLGKVIYADLFRPKKHGVAEKKAMEIKSKVRKALEANVR